MSWRRSCIFILCTTHKLHNLMEIFGFSVDTYMTLDNFITIIRMEEDEDN